jgi:hypothetical protein
MPSTSLLRTSVLFQKSPSDPPETRAGAQALPGLAAIDRPGDHDWYSLRGSDLELSRLLDIRVVSRGLGCTAVRPLFVILRNPEGRWIRTYSVSTDGVVFAPPQLPDRYYLEIRATDSTCFALLYAVTFIGVARGDAGSSLIDGALLCRIAHNARERVRLAFRRIVRRRRTLKSRAARRRYAPHVRTLRTSAAGVCRHTGVRRPRRRPSARRAGAWRERRRSVRSPPRLFGAQVATLGDVAQPGFAQRRVALIDQRLVADVAGLRDEDRAQARREAVELGAGLLVVGERVDESGLRGDLEHEVG